MWKRIVILILILWLCFPNDTCAATMQMSNIYASNMQTGSTQTVDASASSVQMVSAQTNSTQAQATQEEVEEDLFAEFDFSEIESFLQEQFPEEKTGFLDLIKQLISGEAEFSLETILDMLSDQFFYEFKNAKSSIINILAIVIIAAIFHNFSGVFKDNQVSEIGFFVLYMLLITICLNSFQGLMDSAISGLGNLLNFLQLLGPIYFLAVAIATGSATSIAFYQMILVLICIVELVIQGILIPLVQIYMMIRILNDLSPEEYLSKFGDLIRTIIIWALRTLLGCVIGINLIQGMLNPAIDSVKRSVLTRGGEAIPVIGDMIGGAAEVVLGTAVLIRKTSRTLVTSVMS